MGAKSLASELIRVDVGAQARDEIHLEIRVSQGEIDAVKLTGVGCTALLELLKNWRPRLTGKLAEVELPLGSDHASMLLRESILRAQGRWLFPYPEAEICHCRAVSTLRVDGAVLGGCHDFNSIKAATSASTSCGTCRPDVESVLRYRLGKT